MSGPVDVTSRESVRRWLVELVAGETGIPPADIDDADPFTRYGIDSARAATIAAEVERATGRTVDATALYEHPSIADLAAHLTSAPVPARAPRTGPGPASEEPVAIVGMSCRVPGAAGLDELWELLLEGRDAIREVPADRWGEEELADVDGGRWGGFIDAVDRFDAGFFRIPAEEAARMDPQQRLLLELSWEALEDAGELPARLRGSRTGVFVGISVNDYGRRQLQDRARISGLTPLGNALSIAANRLSYAYDLRGPSLAVDTACSSSLVAAHLALRSLRSGECERALVCGVNLLLEPDVTLGLGRAGMLAPDGRCKTFAAAANGYVRGEGCAVAVLEPLSRAVRDRDRIYALVAGSAVNQDGRTNGLTAPSPQAQQAVLRSAYSDAGADPAAVAYVECHGTGTLLGDPIEARALGAVVGERAAGDPPCLVGSVKTNIGHLEAAAGIAGLVKVALSLHHDRLPPSLHFTEPNPHIPFAELGLEVVAEARGWPGGDGPRLAGVSSFGFGGTNAHVVLRSPPAARAAPGVPASAPEAAPRPHLLPVSAPTPDALAAVAAAWAERVAAAGVAELPDLVHTAAARRTHHRHRRAVVGAAPGELSERLRRAAAGPRIQAGPAPGPPRVAFVFSGQGPQWPGMARGLLRDEALFTSVLGRCDELLRPLAGWSLLDVLSSDGAAARLEDTAVAQPLLFAVQTGLASLLHAAGVEPAAVIGHSVGEIAAAIAAGVLRLEDGLRLAFLRGRAMAPAAGRGRMLATDLAEEEAAGCAARFPGEVVVAAVNGPAATVLSGEPSALERVHAELEASGRVGRWLPVAYAFHSHQVREAGERLAGELGDLAAEAPRVPWYSTVTGARAAGPPDAVYWRRNVQDPVRFAAAVGALLDDGVDALVELGPHPVLVAPLRQLTGARGEVSVLPTLHRDADDRRSYLEAVARLYELGCDPSWRALGSGRGSVVSAPGQRWERERHWLDRAGPALPAPRRGDHPLLGRPLDLAAAGGLRVWEADLSTERLPLLADHRVAGRAIASASVFIEMALAAGRRAGLGPELELRDVVFHAPLPVGPAPGRVQVTVEPRSDGGVSFRVHSRRAQGGGGPWTLHVSALVVAHEEPAAAEAAQTVEPRGEPVPPPLLYDLLGRRQLEYGPGFRTVVGAWRQGDSATGRLAVAETGPAAFECHPALLDGAFQLVAAATSHRAELGDGLLLPATIESVRWHGGPPSRALARAELREAGAGGSALADVAVHDEQGTILVAVTGLRLQRAASGERPRAGVGTGPWLYETTWRQLPLPPAPVEAGAERWLIMAGDGGLAGQLAGRARAAGVDVVVAGPGREHLEHLLGAPVPDGRAFDAVVQVGGADPSGDPPWRRAHVLARSTVELITAISFAGAIRTPRLWLVTRGAHAVAGSSEPVDPAAAPLWGLAKVIPFELPALQCRRVDLDPSAGARVAEDLLSELLAPPSDEAEVAYRGGERYARRLVPVHERGLDGAGRLPLVADGTYVITGGLGGLGLAVGRWLVEQGAIHLALMGRRAPGTSAQAMLASLEAAGASVRIVQADVRSAEQLGEGLAALRAGGPAIRGVVHAAGTLDDRPLASLTAESLAQVMGSKVEGAWNLHELTAGDPLDWFVLFSSAASILGSPGQASYCAANAFLDALAELRRSRGLPACSINWGPWADVGMAARSDAAEDRQLQTGAAALDAGTALRLLGSIVGGGVERAVVLPFDLRNLLQFYPTGLGLPFFEDVLSHDPAVLASAGARQGSRGRPVLDREHVAPRSELERRVAAIWQASLGIDGIGVFDGFFELGGDSVFANQIIIEVGRTLGVRIDPEQAFADLTIAGLAALVDRAMLERLEAMSDEEVRRMLDERS